jgi:RNA polymerase sigma factor (sigma-70 family)
VTHRHIGTILRSLSQAGPSGTDAELLARFAAGRDGDAFAALVERHGRLVWAVCRHVAGSDAEDAFQATFLVLLRNAGRIRKPDSLPAWLHGVAYRVSGNARRAARRRADREQAAAASERTAAVVADSAWDRALAAVHEEVARLPDTLRVPFVLCALEGRTITEAAVQLGWKVSTLSERLGRAKDTLFRRMQARGLAAGTVVALAIAAEAVPAAAARVTVMAASGEPVAANIHILTKGVVDMSMHQFKLMAAGVLIALGVSVGGGARWLSTADAQGQPPGPASTAEEKVRQLEAQLDRAKRELADQKAADSRRAADEVARLATGHWQYAFVPVKDVDAEGFVKLLREREAGGWDYTGQTTLKKEAVWAFRRPLQVRNYNRWSGSLNELAPSANGASNSFPPSTAAPAEKTAPAGVTPTRPGYPSPDTGTTPPPVNVTSPKPEKPAPAGGTPPPGKE